MDGHVMCAVGRQRQVECLREMSDFHEWSDSTAVGHIRFRKGHSPSFNQMSEIPESTQVFASGNWQTSIANQTRMAGKIVRDDGFLQPEWIEWLKCSCGANCLIDCPLHIGVDHQGKIVPEVSAHCFYPFNIFGQSLSAHLHLDCAKPFCQVVIRLLKQSIEGQLKIDSAGITANARIVTAQQLPQRLVE